MHRKTVEWLRCVGVCRTGGSHGGLRRVEVEAGADDCRSSLLFANSLRAD